MIYAVSPAVISQIKGSDADSAGIMGVNNSAKNGAILLDRSLANERDRIWVPAFSDGANGQGD